MKTKLLLSFAVLCLLFSSMQAQENYLRHEVAVSYGVGATSQWLDLLSDVTVITSTLGGVKYEDGSSTGSIGVEYFYNLGRIVGLGAVATYGQRTQDIVILGKNEGKCTDRYISFMPAAKFNWVRLAYFGMYSKVALGVTYRSESQECRGSEDLTESATHFNCQASFLGLEFGSAKFRGFTELGVGEQGILVFGLRYKF